MRIVHVVHGWPPFQRAGTEMYAWWLVRQQQKSHHVAVYTCGEARDFMDDGVRVRITASHGATRNPLRRNALRDRAIERDFERFLDEERPDLLHIHHLVGHTFALAQVARRRGVPIVLQIQDWWYLCARVNLFDANGTRCSGPAPSRCARCAPLTRIQPMNRLLHAMRRSAARAAIASCDAYVAGSNAVRDDYVRAGVIPSSKPFHVIPYGVDLAAPIDPRPPTTRPIRFGYVGSILPHKGVHTAVEAMRGVDPTEATLQVWGNAASPAYIKEMSGNAAVVFRGAFAEEEKPRVFASMDVLVMPSIGLESFGIAAREAMTCGVPVIATEGGALSEMTCGAFFPAGDAVALSNLLRRAIDEPELVDRWRAGIPIPKRSDVHAAEIERVYEAVMEARRQPRLGSMPR